MYNKLDFFMNIVKKVYKKWRKLRNFATKLKK